MGLRRIETGRGYERKVRHGAGTVAEGRIFYTSGMTPRHPEGNVVGKAVMAARSWRGVRQHRQRAARSRDRLRTRGEVHHLRDRHRHLPRGGRKRQGAIRHRMRQSSTLVQVARAAHPDFLVEVEAIAVLD